MFLNQTKKVFGGNKQMFMDNKGNNILNLKQHIVI